MDNNQLYDMVIIGGGPAGATAAIYAARAGLKSVILEQMNIGGEIVATDRLDNYPGFPKGIAGAEFGMLLQQQMESLNVPVEISQVESVSFQEGVKEIVTSAGVFQGKTLLVATGTEPNLLGVEGETELLGRGVSYCATCDAAFFRGKTIGVVGGGDAALEETVFLSRFVEKAYLIHRRDQFRGCSWLQDKALELPNVEVLWNTTVSRIEGDKKVSALHVNQGGRERRLEAEGIFIYAGRKPKTGFLKGVQLEQDERGFIITNAKMETSLEGVYAAGDIRKKYLRQVITAASDGAIAATAAAQYIFA